MGVIRIQVTGSFSPEAHREFSAMENGHADAVAQAIEWLAATVLPDATAQDHELQSLGMNPRGRFRRKEPTNG